MLPILTLALSLGASAAEPEPPPVHPGFTRLVLGLTGGAIAVGSMADLVVAGDSTNAGDPMYALAGVGLVAIAGSVAGSVADALTAHPDVPVADRLSRPMVRLSVSPGGTPALGETVPWGLGLRLDPTWRPVDGLQVQPHLGVSLPLGDTVTVDPVATTGTGDTTFAEGLRSRRWRLSAGTEVAWTVPRSGAMGTVEIRARPTWELRRRTLRRGHDDAQIVEHEALFPLNLGLRWHVAPRQRFTAYLGPRIDWISFSDPGSTELRRGGPVWGTFYGEAWWQLDLPLTSQLTGRLNAGYIHSNLDNERFDVGAVVGYFGPLEVALDLRHVPTGVQLTVGSRIGTGGGPFLEVGWLPGGGS